MTYEEIQQRLTAFPADQFFTLRYDNKTYFGYFKPHKADDEVKRNLWQFEISYPSGNKREEVFKGDRITEIEKAYPETAFKR